MEGLEIKREENRASCIDGNQDNIISLLLYINFREIFQTSILFTYSTLSIPSPTPLPVLKLLASLLKLPVHPVSPLK